MLFTDSLFENFPASLNGFMFDNRPLSFYSNHNPETAFNFDASASASASTSTSTHSQSPSPSASSGGEHGESSKYSNPILRYISDILMDEEDDLERKPCMLQDSLRLQAAEKSFYDVLADHSSYAIEEEEEEEKAEEERSNKVSALSSDDSEPFSLFDEVLLCKDGNSPSIFNEPSSSSSSSMSTKPGRSKNKGTSTSRTSVDLWTLLTQCAQAVASYDQRTASEILKQIRLHSSPNGDGLERLAYYFADGLHKRLAAGSPKFILFQSASAADMLKAYRVYITASPFHRMSNFLANRTILKLAQHQTTLHIIDFGINYGFQWPCLIQRLSERPGGPPKLHITGIDFPQSGFRPAERVQETGRRLQKYCKRFGVPFEYHCFAQRWESIRLEDLKIDPNEVTVVNCLYRLENLSDETVSVDCPRDSLLRLIRRINPHIFIHGVVNGTYNAPFFLTRFREALFHFSSLFDMFDATVRRDDPSRLMFEKGLFGRNAINVIACEGAERVERPETYKQWQVRNQRAGFKQIPLAPELLSRVKEMVKREYHKDFVVDENGKWILQGWKGRILHAVSSWVPA